ncbi:hypothetical protein HS088_TW04G00778 [Tripterygium wilfordii]|uniref:Uncharacterized protein n=1 Tax=Tripterygium wilfordii TaxID=458696 RepID=A0A7J7DR20_TRIWF|nr:hypothetical protein HS088_TW04G00778 [Tripterygium wilfordii]
MAAASIPKSSNFLFWEHWFLMTATVIVCAFLGYVVYDAVMATASEVLQRLLVISPLIMMIAVHWLSALFSLQEQEVSLGWPYIEPEAHLGA